MRAITAADGLPRDQLACVQTDARAFAWFCTAEGLVRVDGYRARTFGRDAGLDPPGERSFFNTARGRYDAFFNLDAFRLPAPATVGNAKKGLLDGPGMIGGIHDNGVTNTPSEVGRLEGFAPARVVRLGLRLSF